MMKTKILNSQNLNKFVKSFSEKNEQLKFVSSVYSYKHNNLSLDAARTHDGLICVASGIRAWLNKFNEKTFSYSNELCEHIKSLYINSHIKLNNAELVANAVKQNKSIGSCTLAMASLDISDNKLTTTYIGNSGYLILRKQTETQIEVKPYEKHLNVGNFINSNSRLCIVAKSEEQMHVNSVPFQIGVASDDPSNLISKHFQAKLNDIVILGTDAVWDNIFAEQIISIISPFLFLNGSHKLEDIEFIAELIGERCLQNSMDATFKSPFSMKTGGIKLGGRKDDITLVVSQLAENKI